MEAKEASKVFGNIKDYLAGLVIEFMYVVRFKHDDESDAAHEKRVDKLFKELNTRWVLKCAEKGNEFLSGKANAFADAITLIAADASEGKVAGVNAPLRKLDKEQEAKIIELIK